MTGEVKGIPGHPAVAGTEQWKAKLGHRAIWHCAMGRRQGLMDDVSDTDVDAWLDNLEVDPAKARDGRHMRRIAAARTEAEVESAVAAARAAGDSWAMIGTALGISRQSASRRFGTP